MEIVLVIIAIILIIAIGASIAWKYSKKFIRQIDEGEVGYIRHWGRVQRDLKTGQPKLLHSGFYRVNPITKRIDVLPSPNRRMYQDLAPMKFFTNDNATLTVVARIQYRITNPYVFEYDADNPILQVSTIIQSNLRTAINSLSFQQAIGQASVIGRVISDSVQDRNPLIVKALVQTVKQKGQGLKGQELTKAINSQRQNLIQDEQKKQQQVAAQQKSIRDQIAGYGIQVSQATLKEIRPDSDLLQRMNARKEADLQAQANVAQANGQKSVATVSAQGRASAIAASASGSKASANIQADASSYAQTVSAKANSSAASMSAQAASNVRTVSAKANSSAVALSAQAASNSTSMSAGAQAGAISNIASATSAKIAQTGKAYNNMGSNYLHALGISKYASAISQLGNSKSHIITDIGNHGNLIAKLIADLKTYQGVKGTKGLLNNDNHSDEDTSAQGRSNN